MSGVFFKRAFLVLTLIKLTTAGTDIARDPGHLTLDHFEYWNRVFRVCNTPPVDQERMVDFRMPSREQAICYVQHVYPYGGFTNDQGIIDHDRIIKQFQHYGFDVKEAYKMENMHVDRDAVELAEVTFALLRNNKEAVKKAFFDIDF